jgi:hypothetical protein
MKEYLNWALVMVQQAHANPDKARKTRRMWVEKIFEGLRSYRPQTQINKEAVYLSDVLQDESTWEEVGFAVNLQYIRVDHDNDEMLGYVFVHPWGTPPLILKHKKLPVFITVGPGLRWNDSILRELTDNGYNDRVEGATG